MQDRLNITKKDYKDFDLLKEFNKNYGLSIKDIDYLLKDINNYKAEEIRKIGDSLNHNTIVKVDALTKKVDDMEADISQDRAQTARSRILRFGDELRLKQKHSKDMFDSILIDVDTYEKYCAKHEDFSNNVTLATITIVKDVYQECLINNEFL